MLAVPRDDGFCRWHLAVGAGDAMARKREVRILQRPRLHGKVMCRHPDLRKGQDDRVREVAPTGDNYLAAVVLQAAHLR